MRMTHLQLQLRSILLYFMYVSSDASVNTRIDQPMDDDIHRGIRAYIHEV